jgi:hypothetical protein
VSTKLIDLTCRSGELNADASDVTANSLATWRLEDIRKSRIVTITKPSEYKLRDGTGCHKALEQKTRGWSEETSISPLLIGQIWANARLCQFADALSLDGSPWKGPSQWQPTLAGDLLILAPRTVPTGRLEHSLGGLPLQSLLLSTSKINASAILEQQHRQFGEIWKQLRGDKQVWQ